MKYRGRVSSGVLEILTEEMLQLNWLKIPREMTTVISCNRAREVSTVPSQAYAARTNLTTKV